MCALPDWRSQGKVRTTRSCKVLLGRRIKPSSPEAGDRSCCRFWGCPSETYLLDLKVNSSAFLFQCLQGMNCFAEQCVKSWFCWSKLWGGECQDPEFCMAFMLEVLYSQLCSCVNGYMRQWNTRPTSSGVVLVAFCGVYNFGRRKYQ